MSDDLTGNLVEFSMLLDCSYPEGLQPELVDRRRLDKLAEEVGEVSEAYGGMVGENPRKGVTHTRQHVLDELLDVAMAALAAYEHIDGHGGNSVIMLDMHARSRLARLLAAMEARS